MTTQPGGIPLERIAQDLDALLRTSETPDYKTALNGVQLANRTPITKVAAAVGCNNYLKNPLPRGRGFFIFTAGLRTPRASSSKKSAI